MSLVAALLALSAPAPMPVQSAAATASTPTAESGVSRAARAWLAQVDDAQWRESWAATGRSFRSLNTAKAWQSASERVRTPLGPVLSRTLISEQDIPAPPHGYTTVRFRTDFANRRGAIETLSLDREDDAWKVVGIYVE